jgi:hypothetical protein
MYVHNENLKNDFILNNSGWQWMHVDVQIVG